MKLRCEVKSVLTLYDRQETQLAILGMVVWVLYTIQDIWNVLHYDTMWKVLEAGGSYYGNYWNAVEYRPELDGRDRKLVETTNYCIVLGLVNPYSYLCCHAQPRDLWCWRWTMTGSPYTHAPGPCTCAHTRPPHMLACRVSMHMYMCPLDALCVHPSAVCIGRVICSSSSTVL